MGMSAMADEGRGPYVGRRAFDVRDHDLFFGRTSESRDLRELWARHPLVILHGPAGCGKTSLLRAGLTPLLAQDADVLPVATITRGSAFPEAALPEHNPHTLGVLSSWLPLESRTRLAGVTLADFFTERALIAHASARPIYAAIDQVETIFSNETPDRYLEDFFAGLAAALRTVEQLRIMLSVRSGTLAALLSYTRDLTEHGQVYTLQSSLDRESALAAINGPAENSGLKMAPGLAESLVDELAKTRQPAVACPESSDGVSPTQLQVVCARLYEDQARTGRVMSLGRDAIGVYCRQVLADLCLDALAEVSVERQIAMAPLVKWFAGAFVAPGGERQIVCEDPGTTSDQPPPVIRALANRHILLEDINPGGLCYRLASDRIALAVLNLDGRPQAGSALGTDATSHLRAAEALLGEGILPLAEKHANRALDAADPEDLKLQADILCVLGNIAFRHGFLEIAEQQYWRAAEIHERLRDEPGVGILLGAIGRIHARQRHYIAALEDLQSAVARSPGDMTLRTELAKVLWRQGQARAAAAVLGTVLSVEPGSPEALAERAQICAERGDASSALDDLRVLLRIRPSMSVRPEVRSAYALALARAGREDTAMEEADAAIASAANSGPVFFRAAKVAHVGGADHRAAALLQKAVEANDPELSPDQMREAHRLIKSIGLGH